MSNKIPGFQSIMLPLLRSLADGQMHELDDVLEKMILYFELSDEDLRIKVPSGQQPLFKNRVTWAISYLKNAGLIHYPKRGTYKITDAGTKVLDQDLSSINIAYLKTFDSFKKWQNNVADAEEKNTKPVLIDENNTPEEVIGDAIKSLNNKLSIDLLELLKSKSAKYFEFFVLKLLERMGYGGAEDSNFVVVGKSGDNGIDGVIYQDQLGIDRVYVQAKKWTENKVQSKDIRDFIGALSIKGTTKGIFITTSSFTKDAEKTVQINPQNRIILIDGQQLAGYAIKYNVGVQVKIEYLVKNLDNDFFEEL